VDEVVEEASRAGEVIPSLTSLPMGVNEEGDYYLVYPGILPDHPLYFVKMLRDRLRLWWIRDGETRVRQTLLCADKRVGAALVLAEGNKAGLAGETALKAEKYLVRAMEEGEKLGNVELEGLVGRAAVKHGQVLLGVKERVQEKELGLVEEALELNRQVREELGMEVKVEGAVKEVPEEFMEMEEVEEKKGEEEGAVMEVGEVRVGM